jgi:RNA polymerase sigma-70 factor (ECF subfamily)
MNSMPDFETLVEAHSTELFAYVWRMLRDTADAEDCLQETFLRAYRSFARLRPDTNHRAWLYKIATNTTRTHLRQRGRIAARTIDLDPDLQSDKSPPGEQVDQRQLIQAVARAVEALPDLQRAALIMRKYQELSYAEIAAALDCTEESARANVYQALKKLRVQFAGEEQR